MYMAMHYIHIYTDKYSAQEKANDKGYLVSITLILVTVYEYIKYLVLCVVGRMKLMPRMSSLKL